MQMEVKFYGEEAWSQLRNRVLTNEDGLEVL